MKKKYIILGAIGVAVVIGGVVFGQTQKNKKPEITTATVERKDLVQSVEEAGSVAASLEVAYGFESSGRVTGVFKRVGDMVKQNDLIAVLDSAAERYRTEQARASLTRAQATLDSRLAGATTEEIQESAAALDRAKALLDQAMVRQGQAEVEANLSVAQATRTVQTAENDLRLLSETGSASQLTTDATEDVIFIMQEAITEIGAALRTADTVLGVDNVSANDAFEIYLGGRGGDEFPRAKTTYTETKQTRVAADTALTPLVPSSSGLAVRQAASLVSFALNKTDLTLRLTIGTLDNTGVGSGLTAAEISAFKSNILTAQTAIDQEKTALANGLQAVGSAENSLSSKQIAFQKAQDDLTAAAKKADFDKQAAAVEVHIQEAALAQAQAAHAKLLAPPRAVDINSLRADVTREQAALGNAGEDLRRRSLRAVTAGTISKLTIDVGENVTAQQPVVTLISSDYKVQVDIAESEIAKVQVNDAVELTFDAFGDVIIFTGRVVAIEPAQTEISGVIYYRTDLIFDKKDGYDIKPGMTANVRIQTDEREHVLVIPQRAVLSKADGVKFVRVLTDAKTQTIEEHTVTVGMRGDDGFIEVISGLNEGETIVTFMAEKKL